MSCPLPGLLCPQNCAEESTGRPPSHRAGAPTVIDHCRPQRPQPGRSTPSSSTEGRPRRQPCPSAGSEVTLGSAAGPNTRPSRPPPPRPSLRWLARECHLLSPPYAVSVGPRAVGRGEHHSEGRRGASPEAAGLQSPPQPSHPPSSELRAKPQISPRERPKGSAAVGRSAPNLGGQDRPPAPYNPSDHGRRSGCPLGCRRAHPAALTLQKRAEFRGFRLRCVR